MEALGVVLAVVGAVEASPVVEVDDLHLEAVDLLDETTEAQEKCLKQPAVTAARNAKFLLDQQMANRFTALTVLKKWEMADAVTQDATKDQVLDPKLQFLH